jgi:hypothetical protein
MRISNVATYALTTSVALTALAGCSGSSQMTPTPLAQLGAANPFGERLAFQSGRVNSFSATLGGTVHIHGPAGPSFMDPRAVGKSLVFVSYGIPDAGIIDIYLQSGKNKLVGQISGPNGSDLATDTAGNLYSANEAVNMDGVTVFAAPYTNGPKLTLSGRIGSPIAVSRRGTVAVFGCTNPSGSQCNGGFLFYAAGSTTPCAAVPINPSTFPNGPFGAAFDRNGNLYFDSYGSGTEAPLAVGKINRGCNAKKVETLTTGNAVVYGGGLRIDRAGRIAIMTVTGTISYSYDIDTYDPPQKGSLGNPIATTPVPSNVTGVFAFRASGRALWVGYQNAGPSYTPAESEIAYPGGGAAKKTIMGPTGVAYGAGIAVSPALVP